ncbi:GMC family oxidoreductase [Streptomyces sp. NPDC096311]|uniref:GMC family oxidoreductase n=1 Tax=Streptomyces sp. NPDC096311 TaxID=3366083 RepID=UPI003815CF99
MNGHHGRVDYIVIGAGSAGCVLANRLSQDGRSTVLLLEAGGEDRSPFIHVPAGFALLDAEKYNWRYTAEPDPSRNNIVEHWGGGRVLGGSSSINGEVWTRGNPADYDEWAALGCEGWDHANVLPYFMRAETFRGARGNGGSGRLRGRRGPLHVSYPRFDHPLTEAYLAAAQQAGLPFNDDYNGAVQDGVGYGQLSQRRGFRHSTARAYLAPARRRRNLAVRTGALVARILVEDGRATGVEYRRDGKSVRVGARREVLLAAGALASPKLLMLSGIGPVDVLDEHGIDVLADSPRVGRGLQEHIYATMAYSVGVPTLNMELTPLGFLRHGLDFALRGRGAVTVAAAHSIAFGRLREDSVRPDYEIIFAPMGLSGSVPGTDAGEGIEYRHDVNELTPMKTSTCMAMPSVSHPRARGRVTLHSARPQDKPRIEHQLLADRDDIAELIAVCRKTREIFARDALGPYVEGELLPGPKVRTDEEWETYLRGYAWRGEHPVGTCAMGSDPESVVDPKLRVRGVQGLRVVDASVMPTLITGHTNAPTVMIAERASDLIRSDAVTPVS